MPKPVDKLNAAISLHQQLLQLKLSRRHFLALLSALPASLATAATPSSKSPAPETLPEPWRTFAAVQAHMLPSEKESPGAREIHAIDYLQTMLAAPDIEAEEKDFLRQGTQWLNDLAKKNQGDLFVRLNSEQKETILRKIEQSSAGNRWLSLMLTYLIEALLADPVYGGNYQQQGWTWLEHQAGFPTPTENKMYYKLGQPVYRNTKA